MIDSASVAGVYLCGLLGIFYFLLLYKCEDCSEWHRSRPHYRGIGHEAEIEFQEGSDNFCYHASIVSKK